MPTEYYGILIITLLVLALVTVFIVSWGTPTTSSPTPPVATVKDIEEIPKMNTQVYEELATNVPLEEIQQAGFLTTYSRGDEEFVDKDGGLIIERAKNYLEQVEIKRTTIVVKETFVYDVEVHFQIFTKCPVDHVTVSLVKLGSDAANPVTLKSVTAFSGQRQELVFSGTLQESDTLQVRVKTSKCSGYRAGSYVIGVLHRNTTRQEAQSKMEQEVKFDQEVTVRQYIPSKPPDLPCPATPFTPQTLSNKDVNIGTAQAPVIPWTANVIPWRVGQQSVNGGRFNNGQTTSNVRYDKFASIPRVLPYYAGVDFDTIAKNGDDLTVFMKNFLDRGPDNLAKLTYMFALTSDKLPNYIDKIDALVNRFYNKVSANAQPVHSAFKQELVLFFLSIHLGEDEFPAYVVEYFASFIDCIGYLGNPVSNPILLRGRLLEPSVRKYVLERANKVVQSNDKSTFVFWWNLAGMSMEALVTESLHNIVAFIQFANVLNRLVVDAYYFRTQRIASEKKAWEPDPVTLVLPIPTMGGRPFSFDFFQKYKAATTPAQRLNVVREVYRLMTPNSSAISLLDPAAFDPPKNVHVFHVWTSLMIAARTNLQTQVDQVIAHYTYNPDAYNQHHETSIDNVTAPATPSNDPRDYLDYSSVDDNKTYHDGTVIDKTNRKVIPVFDHATSTTALSTPYYPFGMSYRRCPGEIFSYLLTDRLLNRLKDAEFEYREVDASCSLTNTNMAKYVSLAPRTVVLNNLYIKPTAVVS